MVTQAERNQATRSALLDAGRALFAQRGYAAVPVGEIASRAGVSTGALYHQFGSKQDLFKAVYADLVRGVWARVLGARESHEQPSLLDDCEAYIGACADPAFNRITIDGPTVVGADEVLDEAEAMVAVCLVAARERGEIRAPANRWLARMLAAALKEAAMLIATADDSTTAREAARESVRRLIAGL